MGIPSRARVFAETEQPQLLVLRHTCRSGKELFVGALFCRGRLRPRSAAVMATTSRTAGQALPAAAPGDAV